MSYGTMMDIFGAAVVGSNVMIWLVARRLAKIDPGYFQTRDGSLHWWDINSLIQVLGMIFDRRLPDPAHGPSMRKDIYMIRILYVLGILGSAFFFYLIFAHPQMIFPR